jgi:DNA-binding response OmpR family regulator
MVSDEAEAQLMDEGADDYIRKPLEPAVQYATGS